MNRFRPVLLMSKKGPHESPWKVILIGQCLDRFLWLKENVGDVTHMIMHPEARDAHEVMMPIVGNGWRIDFDRERMHYLEIDDDRLAIQYRLMFNDIICE